MRLQSSSAFSGCAFFKKKHTFLLLETVYTLCNKYMHRSRFYWYYKHIKSGNTGSHSDLGIFQPDSEDLDQGKYGVTETVSHPASFCVGNKDLTS